MAEFEFEGGYRGDMDAMTHHQDRQEEEARNLDAQQLIYKANARREQQALREKALKPDPVPEDRAVRICGVPAVCEDEVKAQERRLGRPVTPQKPVTFQVGKTVWLELSRGGPFKVVGRYLSKAEIPAQHPHDAPNVLEKVTVDGDLWLCQDAKGKVHILAGGSLTLAQPKRWTASIAGAWSEVWARREIALWAALAGLVAKTVLG